MSNATTHIKTDKQLVPALRFKEFEGDWNKVTLGNTSEIVGGGTPETGNDEYWNGNHQWFTPTELKSKYVSESKRTISDLGLKKSSAKLLPKGTLLFSSRATVGDVSIALREVCTNQGFQSFIVNEDNSNEFLYNWIIKNKNLFLRRASGSTFLEISKKEILKLNALIPSLPEQQKIASFLSAVDEKIQQLTKKKDLLEQYKKGGLQQLFSGQLRFKDENGNPYPDWEEKKLGEICDYKNGGSFEKLVVDDGEFNLITLNSIDINGKLKSNHKKVAETDNSLLEGDLIMVLSDVAHGNFLGLSDIIPDNNYVLNQRMGALKPKVDLIRIYLKTFINYNQKYFKLMGQGSSQQNLSKGDILNFKVLFPIIEEQQKIATYISSIDTKIESVNNQITQSQTFKKGLLQQMFV